MLRKRVFVFFSSFCPNTTTTFVNGYHQKSGFEITTNIRPKNREM